MVSIDRKWVGFGSFLGHFKRFCPLKPRKYEKTIIRLTNVLLFMSVNEDCLWVMAVEWFYLLLKASAGSSGRPCGVYMFSGLTTLDINIYNITSLFF